MESLQVLTFLKDIYALKKPFVTEFHGRKNEVLPFEDIIPIENMCKKNDASLFLFGNHNKKRPHNLILGRIFDGHLLDMVEMGISGTRRGNKLQLRCTSHFIH